MKPWRVLAKRILLERPPWFTVGLETVELPDGRVVADFGFIDMLEFAVVVPITVTGETILIRSYKHGTRGIALSLPAGGFHTGEDPLAGAKRELLEETGFEAERWESLGRFVVDSNRGCGAMHAFVARDARKTSEPNSGDLEEQQLILMPFADALAKLRAGDIAQLSTAAALGLAAIALGGSS
ncbi:MAG: NUDIX hydrolase [Candidatus Limnocylindria bacterium]